MANRKSFIRKSPRKRLGRYLQTREAKISDEFDWSADRKLSEFIDCVATIIEDQYPKIQDRIMAELDLLASLANDSGAVAIHQICDWEGINLEGFEGIQDKLLFLAIERPELLNRIAANASFAGQLHGKFWSTFQFTGDDNTLFRLDDEPSQKSFMSEVLQILDLPEHRKHEADWYKSIITDPVSNSETTIHHANIYVEDHAEVHLSFNEEALERSIIQTVAEISIACNPKEKCLDIFAKGPNRKRKECAAAFAQHLAPNATKSIETPRRNVLLERLRREGTFELEPSDGVTSVEVLTLELASNNGLISVFHARKANGSIYNLLSKKYGDKSALLDSSQHIIAAVLQITLTPTDGRRGKRLNVKLRAPNSTNMPNKTEKDWYLVQGLLERWGLLEPIEKEPEVGAAA